MIRVAIIEIATSKIVNVIEYEEVPSNPPPGFDDGFVAVANESVGPDWTWDGSTLSPPVVVELPTDLTAYAAQKRWEKETAGVEFSGIPIATDDRSKLMITGARVAADADPAWSTVWQGADGNIYPLDAAAMIAISNVVSAHVGACFATYATVKAGIDAGTITTTAAIDAAFA